MGEISSYDFLIQRLDQFIRKYYTNKLLRGVLITVGVCVGLFVLYAYIESQFYLSVTGRKVLFFSYLAVFLTSFIGLVIAPLTKYFKLGQTISHNEAAKIIGTHFSTVEDKLLNILQLKSDANSQADNSLIIASINQKANDIKVVPFSSAINLANNRKYLKYAVPPVLALLFMLFAAPSLITDSTYRIINNDTEFERPAPFQISFPTENLEVVQYDDFNLQVHVDGEQLPNELFIKIDDYEYRLNKENATTFSYLFSNVRKDTKFEVYAGRARSGEKTLSILAKPKMLNFDVQLNYPKHTGRKSETITNVGDLSVPEGTVASWTFNTKSTDQVNIQFGDQVSANLETSGSTKFLYRKSILQDESYQVTLANSYVRKGDSLSFFINAIRDEFPFIDVEFIQDSVEQNIYYFVGNISDDYGLTSLKFNYEQQDEKGNTKAKSAKDIPFTISKQAQYQYILDIKEYDLAPGDKFNYYFEVYDNDGIRGAKSSKTSSMTYRKKTIEEIKAEEQENEEKIKDKLKDAIDESKEIKEELQKLREKLLQKQEPDWQDKKQLQQLLERQQNLKEQLEESKKANEQNLQNQEEFMNMSPEMQEKQERMQELFEEMVSDEMKDLMEQIQELMQEMNKEQTLQKMEEFQMSQESLEKEMERLTELYKQLEVEKEMQESIEKLEELAEELEKLSEETKKEEKTNEELKKEQEEINKEFEELKKETDELKKKNDELEFPKPMEDDMPEQMEDTQQDLENSEEQLDQQQNQNASESQKKAAQKMKKMAGSMKQKMQSGEQEEMSEDIETIRQLLENLVALSFNQEDLINSVNRTTINTPQYVSQVQDQKRIKDDFKIVEDTLQALSKRQPDIETFVLEKVTEVKTHLNASVIQLEERKKPEANQDQRITMKNLNDLALMLSESMEQMQQQMSGMMGGSQNCEKPGGSSPNGGKQGDVPMDKIGEGQEKMSEELQKMLDKAKSGMNGNSSKDFAQAAARQAALRKALENMKKEQQEQGGGFNDQLQQIIDEMNKQEIDLVNKRLDAEMMNRQQDIMTRLLESENAQREREYDEKRKSETGVDIKRDLPPSLEQYLNERKAVLEQYKYVSPELKPYYRKLVDEYYKKLKRA